MSNYDLQIISHHPQFSGKTLRKYNVEGIDTVGAYGDENFSIVFKNNTWQKVQVKISLDGTDCLTGEPADTSVSDKMWVVNAYDTLTLKAWPEGDGGGAAFIFTSADNSVAVHTHGDLSSRGIIAAAVFTEGNQPITINYPYPVVYPIPVIRPYPYYPTWPDYTWYISTSDNTFWSNTITCSSSAANASNTLDCNYISETSDSLESVAGVGAGQYTEQHITHTAGLIKPIFAETIRVRYLWWDSLVEKLRTETAAQPQPSGFPGDKKQGIDLGSTPRIGEKKVVRRVEQPVFSRV